MYQTLYLLEVPAKLGWQLDADINLTDVKKTVFAGLMVSTREVISEILIRLPKIYNVLKCFGQAGKLGRQVRWKENDDKCIFS